jgi:MFS family permease
VGIFIWPEFWPVLFSNTLIAVVGDVFGPAIAALTLGLVARQALARRLGRNSAFDHAGNVAIAIAAGVIGHVISQRAVFLLVPLCAVFAALAVLSIPKDAIDEKRARGMEDDETAPAPAASLLRNRPLVIFSLCAMLFHFANAPLLPFVGQKLALSHPAWGTSMMSSCIVAAQMIMLPVALIVGRTADRIGRKPILLLGFAVLPVRAVLYTFSDDAPWLIGVQLLDGIGAGIFGAITPLLVSDVMRGTGRFNLAMGVVATTQGIGASLSGLAAGAVVDRFGYSAGFLSLGAAACVALVALAVGLPETARSKS